MSEKKGNKKKILIIIISLIVIVMLVFILPVLYFFGEIFIEMLFNKPSEPTIKHGEFPFEIVYEYEGEQGLIKDTIVCEYEGHSFALDGGNTRDWNCYLKNSDDYGYYYIDKKNQPDLYIYVPMDAEYYMGAPDSNIENARPYIYYNAYEDSDNLLEEDPSAEIELIEIEDPREKVDIRIIEWKPSEPLNNNFK